MEILLSALINKLGGQLHGQDRLISGLAALESARPEEVTFLANPKYRKQLEATQAKAIIIKPELINELGDRSAIVCQDPYLYFAQVANLFYPPVPADGTVHETVVQGHNVSWGEGTEIHAGVCIGSNVVIGKHCRLCAGVVIQDNCVLGDHVCLYPNVTIYPVCQIGCRVTIHAGAVIGADGFGMAWDKDHWLKIPQVGRVVIGDDVEIGANTTIDRGALQDTVIETGVKIDNLVQIAHNVHIGAHTAIAGCVGIAGSCKIGAYCTIGGAAMFVGHIEIADHTFIGGGTLVSRSITKPGHYASSYPLSAYRDWLKNAVHVKHLDRMEKRIKQLEAQMTDFNTVKGKAQ